MKEHLAEKSLLFKVQTERDPDAFALLYDRYVEPIYRFIYFKLSHKEEAEDATAEVFLKSWQYLVSDKGKEVRNIGAFMYTVARNQVIEIYRRRAKQKTDALEEDAEVSDAGVGMRTLEIRDDVERMFVVLQKLKQEYQDVLLFRYIEEYSPREIAQITGKTQTSVRVTLHRALKKLKELSVDSFS